MAKSPSFQARFRAVQTLLAIIGFSLMSGPPGASVGSPLGTGYSGVNPNTVPPTGGLSGAHKNIATSGLGLPTPLAPGSFYLFSVLELASALAAINLPVRMSLADVCVEADDGPGTFEIGYAASNNAHFFGEASGTDATGLIGVGSAATHIPVSWTPTVAIPAATFTANGDLFQATLTFTTQVLTGINPDISAYRAMVLFETFADTTADAQTVTFDNGPAIPMGFIVAEHALATATSVPMGEIDYTNGSQFKHIIPMQGNVTQPTLVPAQPISPALTFAFNQVFSTLGAATNVIGAVVIFY